MGFTAASSGASLDWDLRPYVDAHGITPEPSRKALNSAVRAIDKLRELEGAEDIDEDEGLDEGLAAFAELTQDQPSAAQLRELYEAAPRKFWHFIGWLIGAMSPEAGGSASTS